MRRATMITQHRPKAARNRFAISCAALGGALLLSSSALSAEQKQAETNIVGQTVVAARPNVRIRRSPSYGLSPVTEMIFFGQSAAIGQVADAWVEVHDGWLSMNDVVLLRE